MHGRKGATERREREAEERSVIKRNAKGGGEMEGRRRGRDDV